MEIGVPTTFDERDWDEGGPDEPVRFALVGLGWFGRDVGRSAIEESEYCEVAAVVSGDAEKAERVVADHDIEHALTYEEYADGRAAEAYDAVYVATPNARHLEHAEAAAGLGKHVLCEKPLEATADRARRLAEACEAAGVELMTAYRMQTTHSVRWMRELIRQGAIGEPVQIQGQFTFPMFPGGDPDAWRLDPDLAGGGALMDVGVYPMNTARFLLEADPIAVQGSVTGSRPEFEGVDEHVTFDLEFPDDVTASCVASFNAAGSNRLAVLGTEGRIVAEPVFDVNADREVTVIRSGGGDVTVSVDEPDEMVEEFDYFATALAGDHPLEPGGRHGVVDVEIAEAVSESDETGRRVDL